MQHADARHGGDPEFNAERGHGRVTVGHCGLGQPHLGFRQRELPAAVVAACSASRCRSRDWEPSAFEDVGVADQHVS